MNHALATPRKGKTVNSLLLHTIRTRHRNLCFWLATNSGLVVSDGRHQTAEVLTLYRRAGNVLSPAWESRCRWSPRFTLGGQLIVMDGPGDRIGACSLADGAPSWETPSVQGAVWLAKGKLAIWHPDGEVQLLRPKDGRIMARHRLPRPYVLGLFGDVLVCRDAWLADGEEYRKHVRAKPPVGICCGMDVHTGRTLWEHETDDWFRKSSEAECLEWDPEEWDAIVDCPPVLLLRSMMSTKHVYRGLSPRNLRPLWTNRPGSSYFTWDPAQRLYAPWRLFESAAVVELLDPSSGRIERLASGLPKVDSQKLHWAWGRYLGMHGPRLVFQHANVCVDVLDRKTRRARHYLLPKPVEVRSAGSFGDLLVLFREKALDIANVIR